MLKTGGSKWRDLSENQKIIYDLFFNQNLKVSEIANRRQITVQAIYKTLRKIKDKYGSDYKKHRGFKKKGSSQYNLNPLWRTESLNFLIKPYYFYPRYNKLMQERGNYSIPFKRWRVFLHKDLIRVQSKEKVFFKGKTRLEALQTAEEDFNRFLNYAANKLGFEYMKDGRVSIKCTGLELEKENSNVAEAYNKETGKKFLQIRGKDDKVYFFIDTSKSLEHGYKGKHSFSNSETLQPYLNDLLYNKPLSNSQLAMRLNDFMTALEAQKKNIDKITEILKIK